MIKLVHFFIYGSTILIVWACQNHRNPQNTIENTSETFETFTIHKGTNIAHWLSQSDRRGEERKSFFQQKDVKYLAGLGFDHLRIPIDEEQMFDEQGNKESEAFQLLHNALSWCQENGLRAIVDLHILRSHHFNEDEKPLWTDPTAQEKFLQLWRELSGEFQKYPAGMVAYELMNEPVADDLEGWNQLVARAVATIRETEPERVIVIGSNRWQSADTFDQLKVPANDPHILLSYHFYEPFLLTHYQASWTDLANYQGPVHYPGMLVTQEEINNMPAEQAEMVDNRMHVYSQDTLEKMMQKPIQVAKSLNLLLYCGEWGIVDNAPTEDRLQWYRDMVAIFEKNDVAYANWNYKSDNFGLVDGDSQPNQTLINIVADQP